MIYTKKISNDLQFDADHRQEFINIRLDTFKTLVDVIRDLLSA